MAAIDFPASPAVNDTYTAGNQTWKWNGTTWDLLTNTVVNTLAGTANQVLVNGGTAALSGALTLSLPPDITLSGNLTVQGGNATVTSSTQSLLNINGGSGSVRGLRFRTASSSRWILYADTVAETGGAGSGVGSNLLLDFYDNAGTLVGTAISVGRGATPTGGYDSSVTIAGTLTSGSQTINGSLTLNKVLGVLGTISAAGDITTAGVLISTVAQGTAPLTVSSTTQVTKLNANYVNGCIRPTTAQSSSIASPAASGVTTTPTKWMADLSLPAQANAGRWIVMEKGVFTKTVASDAIEFGMSVDGGSTYFGMARWYGATGNTTWHQTVFGGFNATANTAYTLSSYVYRQSGTGSVSGPAAGDSRFHVIEAWFISST